MGSGRLTRRSGPRGAHPARGFGLVVGWAFLVGACVVPEEGDDPTPEIITPSIRAIQLQCNPEAGSWRVTVDTVGWSAGGTVLWSVDGVYVERHNVLRSIAAAVDGSTDQLRGDLSIVTDFRPAGTGGNTAFTCSASLSALVWIEGLGGAGAVDCWWFGERADALRPLAPIDCPEAGVLGPPD